MHRTWTAAAAATLVMLAFAPDAFATDTLTVIARSGTAECMYVEYDVLDETSPNWWIFLFAGRAPAGEAISYADECAPGNEGCGQSNCGGEEPRPDCVLHSSDSMIMSEAVWYPRRYVWRGLGDETEGVAEIKGRMPHAGERAVKGSGNSYMGRSFWRLSGERDASGHPIAQRLLDDQFDPADPSDLVVCFYNMSMTT